MKHTDKIHKPQQKKSSWIRVLIIKKRIINPNHVPAESREVLLAQELRIKTERKKVMEKREGESSRSWGQRKDRRRGHTNQSAKKELAGIYEIGANFLIWRDTIESCLPFPARPRVNNQTRKSQQTLKATGPCC
jgi:hypothetical protein